MTRSLRSAGSRRAARARNPTATWSSTGARDNVRRVLPSPAERTARAPPRVFHVKRGSAPADGLSPDQFELLRGFERLLLDRALPAGFVSDTDSARLFERHVLDS